MVFLADALMQCSDTSTHALGGQIYKSLLLELHNKNYHHHLILCQEIIEQLGIHIGSSTFINNNNISCDCQEEEECYMALQVCTSIPPPILRPYRPFWFALLDHIQRLPPRHLRKLFLLLFIVTDNPHDDNNNNNNNNEQPSSLDSEDEFSDSIHIVIRNELESLGQ